MSVPAVGSQVVVTPIYWAPSGYSFTSSYKNLINQYLGDAAHDSGGISNVFSSMTQYSGSNGAISYGMTLGTPIIDTNAYPAAGCTTNAGSVYSDNTGYTTCLDDDQAIAETSSLLTANSLTSDLGHIYVMFLPKHVESCFYPGNPSNQACTINSTASSAYCAYHSAFGGSGQSVYALMPFPIYQSPTHSSCTAEGLGGGIQSPNGDTDADVEVSPLSHEMAEAITDPEGNAWFDSNGFENGDDCAYIYGGLSGSAGTFYNQTINGNHYLTQEEFSNRNYVLNTSGCIQGNPPTVSSLSPTSGTTAGGDTVTITGTAMTGTTGVKFGATAATGVNVVDATHVTCVTPAHSAGQVDVKVTNGFGTSPTVAADHFTYVTPTGPTVTNVSPNDGPLAGGQTVTITGTGLTGATAVHFGANAATGVTPVDATHVTATSPAGSAGTVDVTVTTGVGTSTTSAADHYTYLDVPAVTSVSPDEGPLAGGQTVTITGTALSGATAVHFGATAASNLTPIDATHFTATSPAHAAGTVDVTVTTDGGTSAPSSADEYTYLDLPTVTSVSPNDGPVAGGQTVTITGTALSGATAVHFGATAATNVTPIDATHLTATAPAHLSGTVHVTVTTDGGTSATSSADQYTYLDLPTVTNVSPSDGPIAGGQTVTITGTALTGATGVQFGAAAGTNVSVTNATHLTVTAPAHSAGTVHVTVTTDGGTSATSSADQYTYLDVPAVTGVSPSDGPVGGGQTVTITGTALAGATAVDFGSTPATNVANVDGTHVTATIPAHTAGTVDVTVTTDGGTSATSAADQYTYVVAPTVTGVSPSDGPLAGGQTITITGTGLSGATAVHFGTTAATNVANTDGTHVTATIPTHAAGTVDVTVTTDGGTSATSAADDYTYLDTPTVTSVSPNAGPVAGGQTVTITGTAFTGAPEVDFGTAVATNIVVVDTTHLTATAPANAGGTVDVRVTTDGGTSATSGADHYTYAAAPTVTSVSPSAGRRSGGQSVTITGTNFAAGATVQVGGTPATAVVVHSATSITATVPAHAAGTVDVRVATAGGTSAVTAGDHYTYDARPKVTHVSPSSGAKAGGKKVVLTGKHFLSGASVKFGAKAGTRVKVVSATEIKVHTPAHAKGTVDVTVTTPGGTSATKPHDHYTFT